MPRAARFTYASAISAVFCGVSALCVFIVVATAAYLAFALTTPVMLFAALAAAMFAAASWRGRWFDAPVPLARAAADSRTLMALVAIAGDVALIALLLHWRVDVPLQSPWPAVPFVGIALFALTTWLNLLLADEAWDGWTLAALTLHLGAAFGVAELVYAFGFGFDPFIHRATEAHIAAWGAIAPKQPFYNGQYVLVVALQKLTGLGLDLVDRALVPVLAALTLPAFLLRRAAADVRRGVAEARRGWWPLALLLVPFLPLTFTTPNNLAALMLVWVACLLPRLATSRADQRLAALIAIAALATHPLLGVPTALLAAGPWVVARWRGFGAAALAVAMAVAVPLMFALNNLRHGDVPFVAGDLASRLDAFWFVFRSPFPVMLDGAWDRWSAFYAYQAALPFAVVALGVVGVALAWRRHESRAGVVAPLALVAGTVGAAFVLTAAVRVPGIVEWEQAEFAVRLWDSALRLLALLAAPALAWALDRVAPRGAARMAGLAVVAAFVTASWYATYPQANDHAATVGWGVGRQHVETARYIHDDGAGGTYLVLSDQMVSVTALRLYGFENLPYAIPTGGKLYEYYLDLFHGSMSPAVIPRVMRDFGVDTVYVVVNDYYGGMDEYLQMLRPRAAAEKAVADGRAVVLTYRRHR